MYKFYPLLALALCASTTYANDSNRYFEAKLADSDAKTWNVGVGFTQKILHGNVEWVNPYGIAYAKAGVFINDDHPLGGQLGFRAPVHFTGKDKNGYYVGAYAGHIESRPVDGEFEARLGGGIDLAYVMLSSERISTFSVGIGAGEELKNRAGHVIAEIQPRLQFSYTLSIGL
ncbi:hypothetical protein A3K93_03680 [Acinetobacter sp. NCu2D-2]|uniref:hypothetical protein n=1 Tax=Acinetobacter sp. NCu2D-2 TaxID=1608473 RepID=UPI0007CDB20F|nr:hypothetical protein [Acinetobacter sp. NCu2D-2]ANF83087.1 hypothetical protein A3K93_03680 [Acinetobacter sp. NCu2D-2]